MNPPIAIFRQAPREERGSMLAKVFCAGAKEIDQGKKAFAHEQRHKMSLGMPQVLKLGNHGDPLSQYAAFPLSSL